MRINNFFDAGIKWKSGMWSKQENEILKRNIDDYLKTNNIASAEEVIFELSKEERKDFYRTIGIEKVNIKLS